MGFNQCVTEAHDSESWADEVPLIPPFVMETVAPPALDIYKQITQKLKKRYAFRLHVKSFAPIEAVNGLNNVS